MKTTAFETIQDILKKEGVISNYWCIDNRVTTRLSDAIFKLRNNGWNINTVRGKDMLHPKEGDEKNTYYQLIK